MSDIIPYLNKPAIISEISKQIIKDFAMVGLTLPIAEQPTTYEQLFLETYQHVSNLMNGEERKLQELLYRIDISEEQIKNDFAKAHDQSFEQIVTEVILKREAQKVILRQRFSK